VSGPEGLGRPSRGSLLEALARIAGAPTLDAAADLACEAVVAGGRWGRAAYVYALPTGVVFGCAGLANDERERLRAEGSRYGPVERALNRQKALDSFRLAYGLDVAFIPEEQRHGLWASRMRGAAGSGPAGQRWEADDELILLPHDDEGASLGSLALSGPSDGRRPTAASAAGFDELLAFAGAVGAVLRSRVSILESGREQSRRVLDHVQSLTGLSDVGVLLDRVAEVCARLAGYHVAVLTAHMEDGTRVGAFNVSAEERARFVASSRNATVEGTASKRAKIRAAAFPGTGIAYVPKDAELSRSRAFTPGHVVPGGSWHAEDRLFVLLKTTQGRDIGVLSLDEPLDGRAPTLGSLGALRIAERFLDLAGALLETRLLQAQVERTQRLEAVGALVAGVAHDFNNLLGAIMGYASLLRVQLPEGSDLLPTARALEEACERAAGATRRLRALTQAAPAEQRPVDPTQLVADVARTARDTFDPRYVVETDVAGGLPSVLGDPGLLARALLNLCINARDAQPEGGSIVVRARPEGAGNGAPATGVIVEIEDQGPGLSSDARLHLFEPFFTTKGRGKGTGLGLFGAWTAARAHGGHLEAVDRAGPGALFRMHLPAAGRAGAVAKSGEARPVPAGARVLLIEDERAIQDLLAKGIELLGHRVEAVMDGQSAIELLESRAGEFDLVLLDLLLPRRSGVEVFRALRHLRTDLPVILSSGNVEEALLDGDLRVGVSATLPKPWTLPQLQDVVQRVLGEAPPAPRTV